MAVVLLGLAHLLDGWAYEQLLWGDQAKLERRDWYRLGRVMGYLPTWLALGAALVLVDAARVRALPELAAPRITGLRQPRLLRLGAARVVLGAAFAGALAEVLKVVIGRERPDGLGYTFRPIFDGLRDGGGLGFPSSHASVAFGAAWALRRVFPGCGWVVIPLAMLCALGRMQAGGHYLSDVVAGALVGWLGAALAGRLTR